LPHINLHQHKTGSST